MEKDREQSASHEREQPSWSWGSWFVGLLRRLFILFLIYALSIGPLYWHWYGARYAGGPIILAAFYEPLIIIANLVPPFGEWMDWYVGLWIT